MVYLELGRDDNQNEQNSRELPDEFRLTESVTFVNRSSRRNSETVWFFYKDDKLLEESLTNTQIRLVVFLLSHAGEPQSVKKIYLHFYSAREGDDIAVEAYGYVNPLVSNTRKKLKSIDETLSGIIKSKYGKGYVIDLYNPPEEQMGE